MSIVAYIIEQFAILCMSWWCKSSAVTLIRQFSTSLQVQGVLPKWCSLSVLPPVSSVECTMSSAKILWKEFRELTHPKTGLKQVHVDVEENDVFLWKVSLMVVDPESIYNGACLQGQMRFPSNYPYSPPSFRFTPAIFHPNVYPDGRLCISILHSAGQQEASDEPLNITWSPAQKVESVLLSILSLLEDPNVASPANVEAGIAYRKQRDLYNDKVKADVLKSIEAMPSDIVWPTLQDVTRKQSESVDEPMEYWEDDFYDDEYGEEEDDEDDDNSGDDDGGDS